jgi:hypothetical protein
MDEFVQLTSNENKIEWKAEKGNLKPPLFPFSKRYRSSGTICYSLTIPPNAEANLHLHGIGKSLVHLGDLGRNAQVDSAVANLNDESTNEVGVDLVRLANIFPKKKHLPNPDSKHTLAITLSFLP